MTNQEKLNHLEELLDIDKNTLTEDTVLENLSQWDSMSVIATIAMLDSDFGKVVTSAEVKGFTTIKDIMDKME
jgi:acyl carrier protein